MEGPEGDDPKPMTIKNVPARTREMFTAGAAAHKETMAQFLDRTLTQAAMLAEAPVHLGPVAAVEAPYCTDLRAEALGRLGSIAYAVKGLVEADAINRSRDQEAVLVLSNTNVRAVRATVGELLREIRGLPPLQPRLRGAVLDATRGDRTPMPGGEPARD